MHSRSSPAEILPAGCPKGSFAPLQLLLPLTLFWACTQAPPPTPVLPYRAPMDDHAAQAMPSWVQRLEVESERICGTGVAGASFQPNSPYPRELSRERAIRNLAGILGTRVQEAVIDRETHRSTQIRHLKVLTVDEALIEKLKELSQSHYWLDVEGKGPYATKGFTYARSCVSTEKVAQSLNLGQGVLRSAAVEHRSSPQHVPSWMSLHGRQPGGRLCAVGFSLPTFHPEKTFQGVVEDIRGQLAEVLETFVSTYYEERSTERGQWVEAMTLATTEAVSKGAVVTDYWYDRDGIGPSQKKRSTYGWGCVYPVSIIQQSSSALAERAPPEERDKLKQVQENAASAFADLEIEIDKHAPSPNTAPDSPLPSAEKETNPQPTSSNDPQSEIPPAALGHDPTNAAPVASPAQKE